MPTWCFKTATRSTRESVVHRWYWQIDTQHTLIAITSPKLFETIEACIENARENGFRGEVEMPDVITLPAMITCEEGDYVLGIVERSMSARASRPLA